MMWAWDEWWASTDTGSDLRRVLSLSLRRDMTMKSKSEPETISSSLLMSLRREFRLKLHQETGPWAHQPRELYIATREGVHCDWYIVAAVHCDHDSSY